MREILFRGQTRKKGQKVWMDGTPVDGQWVYGGVTQGIGDFSVIYGGKNANDSGEGLKKWCVYTDTLGQFTGLTDKNGTKIFEGDILKSVMWWCDEPKNGIVTFKDGAFGFIWLRGEVEMFHAFTSVCNVEYEVIGNIHDNPELLKGENNG